MLRHVWTVLCRTSSVDKDSNNISLLEVTEQLGGILVGPVQPPALPFPLTLVTLWCRSEPSTPVRGNSRLRVVGPDGADLIEPTVQDVNLMEHLRTRLRASLAAIPYSGPGFYEYVMERETDTAAWEEVARVPLEVKVEFQEGQVTPPSGGDPTPPDQP